MTAYELCVCACVVGYMYCSTLQSLVCTSPQHFQIEKDLAEKLRELADMRQQVTWPHLPVMLSTTSSTQKATMESDLVETSKALLEAKTKIERHQLEHQAAVSDQEKKVSCLAIELESTKRALELAKNANCTEKVNEPDL